MDGQTTDGIAMRRAVETTVFTGSIARSARRRYLIYSEADFDVFCPAGATRCTPIGAMVRVQETYKHSLVLALCLVLIAVLPNTNEKQKRNPVP